MKKVQQTTKLRTFEDTDKFNKKVKYPRQAMIKYDGRCTTIVKHPDQTVQYFTTGGKMFELLDDQVFGFDDTPVGVYFAEMMGKGIEGRLGERVHSGIQTTMFTNTAKGLFNRHTPTWRIFDCVDIADYDRGFSDIPFIVRFSTLKHTIGDSNCLAYDMECENKAHWDMFHTKVVADGWEGTVCIDHQQQWKATRSRPHTQIKRKDRLDADLLCIGVTEGTGKYEGMVGSLKLQDSKGRIVDVGSGLSDAQRNPDTDYIGSVIEIVYEQMMETYVQPIFVRVRDDKTKEDIT